MDQEENRQRYLAACHAIQTGVAFEHSRGSEDGTPKHLRTGVNIAMCDHAALVKLLIAKGLFTDEAEEEVKRYEERLGGKVTLV